MVNNCCVVGCTNYVGKKQGLSFYRFPLADKERCSRWEAAVRRANWHPKPHSRICSDHFESGKPNAHPSHPDYVPSVFPSQYHISGHRSDERRVQKMSRLHRQMDRQVKQDEAEKLLKEEQKRQEQLEQEKKKELEQNEKKRVQEEKERALQVERQKREDERERLKVERERARKQREEEKLRKIAEKKRKEDEKRFLEEEKRRQIDQQQCQLQEKIEEIEGKMKELEEQRQQVETRRRELEMKSYEMGNKLLQLGRERMSLDGGECFWNEESTMYLSSSVHAEQQTDETSAMIEKSVETIAALKKEIALRTCGIQMIEGDSERTKYYTGLTWEVFEHVYSFLVPHISLAITIRPKEEFLFVLMRLRLGLQIEDLASRFGLSLTTASRSFQKWLDVLYCRLKFLIKWPSREIVKRNMPPAFRQLYPECICIIDSSEIFIETPTNYDARSATYSNYKKHNTIKFLIAITPCGSISFLSKCWGGRVSDKVITQESNFLSLIEPGNVVLADRGFTINDDLALQGAKLEIPAFTRGKNQLSKKDVEYSKQLSTVRIHVERVIGHLKKKYKILRGPLPVKLLKHASDTTVSNIDKILVVCAALTNLTPSVV